MRIAVTRRIVPAQQRFQAVVGGDHQAAVEQCHADVAALARLFALVQRRQHALRRVHPGHHVDRGDAKFQRRLGRFTVERHQARFALDHQVVAGPRGFRAGAVVPGDRAVDQARLLVLQGVVAQAQPLDVAELEVLDHDVALADQIPRDGLAFRCFQVEAHRTLVAVDAVEVRGFGGADAHAPVARVVAALGVLHLDHFGAQVAQHHRAPRPGQHTGEVQHAHAGKRQSRFVSHNTPDTRLLYREPANVILVADPWLQRPAAPRKRARVSQRRPQCLPALRRRPATAPSARLPGRAARPGLRPRHSRTAP